MSRRRLILFRHAKSSWDDPDLDDFDRGLAPRGVKAAKRMGAWLAAGGHTPGLILCSTAVRTRATLALMLREFPAARHADLKTTDDLYLAPAETIIDHVRAHGDGHACVMVIGHNPGMHAAALALTATGKRKFISELAIKYPTAAVATLRFDLEAFSDLAPATGHLEEFQTPRALDADTTG